MIPEKNDVNIWAMALGYFLFYIPYSALVKAVSDGLLPGMHGPISGLHLLPVVLTGSFIMFQLILYMTGWWKYAGKIRIGTWRIPFTRSRSTFYSGIATAVIIATTTLAYTFSGISIVFTLLLMRGGVLILAPLIDKLFHRRVNWYSWVALSMSFLALGMALADQKGYALTTVVVVNIIAYLSGYLFRLRLMTRYAKSHDQELTYRYFAEEMIVASVTLALAPTLLALLGVGESMLQLREGFTSFFTSNLAVPGLSIGFLYAWLYIFGTRIYLDQRENTFCIPVNRCSSLLSGVVASFVLSFLFGKSMINQTQLISAGIIIVTLLLLSYPALTAWRRIRRAPLRQLYVFVCSGNTSRSPIAQAICTAEMANFLGISTLDSATLPVHITSAGLSVKNGDPLHPLAATVLTEMNVTVPKHRASNLTTQQVEQAKIIWCMDQGQKSELLQKFPGANGKVRLLNPESDIENPAGKPIANMRAVAQQISTSIKHQLRTEGWLTAPVSQIS